MRRALFAAALLASSPVLAQAPVVAQKSARVCLHRLDIRSALPARDDRSITFTMRNGDKWQGDLGGSCPGIRFNGFSWTLLGGDGLVCENMLSLQVLRGGPACMLRGITKLAAH